MRRWFAGLVAFGMVAGCSLASEDDGVVPDDDDVVPVAMMALVSFDACADVLDHLKREATDRVGPWGLGGGGIHPTDGTFAMEDSAMAGADSMASAPQAEAAPAVPQHSTTNVQEVGVDEPDLVKTDGELVVTVAGNELLVVDVSGGEPREVGRLALSEDEYVDANLLLSDGLVLVLLREYPMIAYDMPSIGYGGGMPELTTTALLVDLSDPADPTVQSRLEVDGNYLDARMVGQTVRLVVSSPPSLTFPMTEQDYKRGEDELTARNREVIAESAIEDWLPSYRLVRDGVETGGQLVDCERLSRPHEFAGFSTLSVLTFDLAEGPAQDGTVAVLTDGDTVYASTDRLYVATTRWGEVMPLIDTPAIMPVPGGAESTEIHAFDISGDQPARYVASGEVDGRIIGRYAMSEHEGVLRVATTITTNSGAALDTGPRSDAVPSSESQLVTLEERSDELVQLGRVGGLGRGEQIYAVRYFGSTGYVVTFRQTDPLYVLDLSDPAEPTVTGELKITGYSAYLHEVGEGRLVGLGQEATTDGMSIGAQVSLFDVSDPAAPAKLAGHVVENAWSQAEWDPHAFLYWPETTQLVMPIDTMGEIGALVLRVGEDSVTEHGLVKRSAMADSVDYAWLTRTLVIGDTLYTLWQDGLQANDLDDLEARSWLSFS